MVEKTFVGDGEFLPVQAEQPGSWQFTHEYLQQELVSVRPLNILRTPVLELLFCKLLLAFDVFQTRCKQQLPGNELLQCSADDYYPEQRNYDGKYLNAYVSLDLLRNTKPVLDETK